MENHDVIQWENSPCLSISIAMLNYKRVVCLLSFFLWVYIYIHIIYVYQYHFPNNKLETNRDSSHSKSKYNTAEGSTNETQQEQ